MHQLEEVCQQLCKLCWVASPQLSAILQKTWRDATALATSKQDDVNQCAAMITDFKASVRDVTEELEHVVTECTKLDRSPGKPFL